MKKLLFITTLLMVCCIINSAQASISASQIITTITSPVVDYPIIALIGAAVGAKFAYDAKDTAKSCCTYMQKIGDTFTTHEPTKGEVLRLQATWFVLSTTMTGFYSACAAKGIVFTYNEIRKLINFNS